MFAEESGKILNIITNTEIKKNKVMSKEREVDDYYSQLQQLIKRCSKPQLS